MSEENRPAKNHSTAELINAKNYALRFIEEANKKISGQGGWIAREANWAEIENAQREINIIDRELYLRK